MRGELSDGELPMWVVYERPKDFPNCYVARLWIGEMPTEELMVSTNVDDIRRALQGRGLVKLMRDPEDGPQILETWL